MKPRSFEKGILIACALRKEADPLRDRLGEGYEYLVTGLGIKRTRESLTRRLKEETPSLLIFTGTAGQLEPGLKMGEVVCPEAWYLEDGTCHPVHPKLVDTLVSRGWEVRGRGITVSAPVIRNKARRELYRKTRARICDMEAAAVLEVAAAVSVPALAPKIVSDSEESGIFAFWSNLDANLERLCDDLHRLLTVLQEN